MKERSTLWIHSQIKACMDAQDCQPDFCLDLFEPSGHGRRRRELSATQLQRNISALQQHFNDTQFAKFKENLEFSVLMPGGKHNQKILQPNL